MTEKDTNTQTVSDIEEPQDEQSMGDSADAPDAAPAAGADAASMPIDELEAELQRHREQTRQLEEQLLRRAAEFQNYRRRTEAELGQAAARGRGEVVRPLLDVLDDLERSLEAAEQAAEEEQGGPTYEALKTGVDLVYKKFVDTLRGLGVEEIEAVGQPFDENQHEAMMQQPVPNAESGTVIGEIQKGYRMGDRVLRHARVIVAQ
jgi:molecular chaperone GrpE